MSRYYKFDEYAFRNDVKSALETVEKILDADRRPLLADNVHHKYENKYDLANHMTKTAIVAQMNVLERLGFTPQIIQQLGDVKTKTTNLRFEASETCTFLKEQTVNILIPDPHAAEKARKKVTEQSSIFGFTRFESTSSTVHHSECIVHKMIKKVKEYHWTIKTHWEITAFSGTDVDKKIMIQSRDSSTIVVTQSEDAPMEKVENHTPVDLNLTWLLQQIDMDKKATTFTIDTTKAKTPRRNEEVDASMSFFCDRMNEWLFNVKNHFSNKLQRIISDIHNPVVPPASHPEQLAKQCSAEDLFPPILPLLEETCNGKNDSTDNGDDKPLVLDEGNDDANPPQSVSTLALPSSNNSREVAIGDQKEECRLLSGKDTIQLLNAQVQSIDTKLKSFNEVFPPSHQMTLFSIAEATLYLLLDHSNILCKQYQYAIEYLESMLEKQLVAAIGKRVTNDDLEEFVRFHNAKFLAIPPRPFCHAIGRPKRFPYGVLSIESKTGGNDNTIPIETMMRPVVMSAPLEVPLNAATTLQLTGNTYLHGWMHHRSERGGSNKTFQLSARARQFSSFLLVIGTMAGPNKLNPKDAIILQNKDEVLIPLLLEEIPSAKEFRDAIESLSPEQQRFAKAFRGMQLESSVFGVAVIQIKPQLEALLGLPEDSLAKEIKLTEDLMELFVEYQVPSDLLSYDGIAGMSLGLKEKVDSVRGNVKAVMDVVEGTKVKQLADQTMVADFHEEPEYDWSAARPDDALWSKGEPEYDWSAARPDDALWSKEEPNYDWLVSRPDDALWSKEEPNYDWSGARPMGRPETLVTLPTTSVYEEDIPSLFQPGRTLDDEHDEAPSFAAADRETAMPEKAPVPTSEAKPADNVEKKVQSPTNDSPSGTETSPSHQPIESFEAKVQSPAIDSTSGTEASSCHQSVDFTSIPKTLDATIEKFDKDSNLRSTKLKTKDAWSRKRQPDLLTKPTTKILSASDVKSESNKAYDLLDAISRSGSLPIAYSDLHVVVCVTHCFEKDIMATVVEDNVNPIEKLEMSTLLLGSAIHGAGPLELIAEESDRARFQSSFPLMLEAETQL